MRVLLGLFILLAFPMLEIWLLVELGDRYGWWLLAYLLVIAGLGWRLIIDEKFMLAGRMMQTLGKGGTPVRALFMSAKNLLAGVLLIIPGVISDAIAAILLLIPTQHREKAYVRPNRKAANDDVIEGEFRREE